MLGRDAMKRKLLLVVAIAVAAAVIVAGASTYLLTRPVDLAVRDVSTLGVIEGNLTSISSIHPLFSSFNATTYANQSGFPSSSLALRVQAITFYVGPLPGYLETKVMVIVLGHFVANLHPSDLSLTGNQTGTAMDVLEFNSGQQAGTNVSFDPQQDFYGIWGNGSLTAKAAFVNAGGAGIYYDFSYRVGYVLSVYMGSDYFGSDHFAGFHVTVGGGFTPSVGVGILLQIINT